LLGDKVVDSRESREGDVIRRRRQCLNETCRSVYELRRINEEFPLCRERRPAAQFHPESWSRDSSTPAKSPVSVPAIEEIGDRIESLLQDRPEKEISIRSQRYVISS
jgi:transcriptional repressor NrdR